MSRHAPSSFLVVITTLLAVLGGLRALAAGAEAPQVDGSNARPGYNSSDAEALRAQSSSRSSVVLPWRAPGGADDLRWLSLDLPRLQEASRRSLPLPRGQVVVPSLRRGSAGGPRAP